MKKCICLLLLVAASLAAARKPLPAGFRGPAEPLFYPKGGKRSTPDGQTPAQETFCTDYYKGVKPRRLFGICNSYCEAMDCDETPVVVQSACFSVGHLLANTAAEAFDLDPDCINPNDTCKDSDVDGFPDFIDNCPFSFNPTQTTAIWTHLATPVIIALLRPTKTRRIQTSTLSATPVTIALPLPMKTRRIQIWILLVTLAIIVLP